MRVLAIFAGAFSAGIFLAQYAFPGGWLLPGALACFLAGCVALILPTEIRKRTLLISLGLSLALGYNWLYVRQIQTPMEQLVGTAAEVTMTLRDYPQETAYGAKVTVETIELPGKLVYYGTEALLGLEPGQSVTAQVYFQDAVRIRDTDVTTFTSKGVFLLAYNRGEEMIGPGSAGAARWWPQRVGQALRERINQLFAGDIAGFMTAILTGEKSALSEEAGTALSEAGLYHILAVSGMHCGFLLSLVAAFTGRQRKRLMALAAIPLLLFYALATGCSPSVVRACVMLSLLVAAPLFRRESDGPTSLLTALLLLLIQNPFAAASVSLQLSFAAVAGLFWLTPKLYRMLMGEKRRNRVYAYIAAGFSATMGALVFSTPISAWYFGTLSLISPVSNLLCLWAAGAVFVTGLLAVLGSFLWWPLGMILGMVPRVLVGYILLCTKWLARLPFHAVYFNNPYLKYWLIFVYVLFAAAYAMRVKSGRKYALSGVLAMLSLGVTIYIGQTQYQNDLDVLVLDVGQGQSVLMASEDCCLLADCGSGNSWYDPGETAAHQLLTMGYPKLDYLLLTHYDADHVSGTVGLLARVEVDTLLVPAGGDDGGVRNVILETAADYGVTIRVVEEACSFPLGKATVMVFPPIGQREDNEKGLSLLADLGETEMLLTGDMSATTERRLLERYALPDVEVLVAGHHGSKYSTSEELLRGVEPETVCISVGSNHYGHPADETMRRLAQHGCAIYRTDLQGTIHISMNEGD